MPMERIAEPDLMDGWEQAIAYAQADFEVPHSAFIEKLKAQLPELPETGHALDLGCGPGDITMRFARSFSQWKVDGLDGAESMLELGRQSIQSQGLEAQIAFHQVYLPTAKAPRDAYDFIFSNSLLHHLVNPMDLWQSLRQLINPHSPVFIMDLMRPNSKESAAVLVQHYAGDEPEVLQTDFYNSLLAAYTTDEVQQQLTQAGLSHLKVEAISDRHWITWGYPT